MDYNRKYDRKYYNDEIDWLKKHNTWANIVRLISTSINREIYLLYGELNTDVLIEECPLLPYDECGYVMELINQYRPFLDDILKQLELIYRRN